MRRRPVDVTPEISWKEWLAFLSPAGQQQIVDFIIEARESRGRDWLPSIKAEFPMACWIIEMTCTKTDDESVDEIAAMYPLLPVKWAAGEQIKLLHARLKYEIERKRDL